MSYRRFYLRKTVEQLQIAWVLFWNGVVLNKGHHSQWYKTWFFGRRK